jgi:arylsulfatase A-like enzyme
VYGGHAPPSLADTLVRLYDGAVRQADDVLGEILEGLRRTGEFDDTLVVVTADHGDGFGEPSALDAEPAPLMHGMGTHEVVYHVPLQVKAPGQTDGRRVTALADVSRFPAAVAAATGAEWDEQGPAAGADAGTGDLGVAPASGAAGPSVRGDPGWFAPEDGRVVAYLPPANGQEAEKARRHTDDPDRYIQELAIVYRDAPGDAVYKRAAWGEDTYTARVVGTAVQDLRPDEAAADLDEHPLAAAQAIADATDTAIAAPLDPEEARVDKYDNDEEIAAIDVEERLRDLGYL